MRCSLSAELACTLIDFHSLHTHGAPEPVLYIHEFVTVSRSFQVNGETVKLGIPGSAQRMEASAKLMIPLQRVGTPEDAAGAMLMLASPYASYITAQV